jgi:RNA polymerase II C-terminal domain phosphatase-like 3/4
VDDSSAVWPQHASQLLVPRRYHYFDSSARRDAALGQAPRGLLSLSKDEPQDLDAPGSQLGALLGALRRIHADYFRAVDLAGNGAAPHVRASVASVRRGVLSGVRLLFTRVIPTGEKRPERHFAWRLATEMGADVATAPDANVTHVVAGARGTDKALWAAKHGRWVVSLDWLTACGYSWSRLDEADFPLTDETEAAVTRARPSDTLPPPAVG